MSSCPILPSKSKRRKDQEKAGDGLSRSISRRESTTSRILKEGVYIPLPTFFFKDTENLDELTISRHAVRMARARVTGLIVNDLMYGEGAHLSRDDRGIVTRTVRHAIVRAGFLQIPIIVSCGAPSARETIELCHDAHASGGSYALVGAPAIYKHYYDTRCIAAFFVDVANSSPLPILVDTRPQDDVVVRGTVGGDASALATDELIHLVTGHPNIAGCRLSRTEMARATRMAQATTTAGLACLGESAGSTLQTLIGGCGGVVAGMGNLAPRTCVRLIELYHRGKEEEARKLQAVVARAEETEAAFGIAGMKSNLQRHLSYGGLPRRPLAFVDGGSPGVEEMMAVENCLVL
ncbi:hypothetical protein ASPZODRAFT_67381 [Penicilliopsis zonata CBS 506.65]|uniref:Dihydrodipicolinate synthase n=1 Tax=Penicilliopsis zonata CBS 506.65 TaxID=1073090 RepID=A0A1L9SG70_9EURO|nr:hypothetical protein ASPZODRAFT_67381 [Penicilliopsis zonata CBS 506.65]OJJ46162.1 hypothetical protein ASPZODRAFT_67381 [Penicilliopsis zonata CBS 506.65]